MIAVVTLFFYFILFFYYLNLDSVSIKEFEDATERVIGGIEKKLPLS